MGEKENTTPAAEAANEFEFEVSAAIRNGAGKRVLWGSYGEGCVSARRILELEGGALEGGYAALRNTLDGQIKKLQANGVL